MEISFNFFKDISLVFLKWFTQHMNIWALNFVFVGVVAFKMPFCYFNSLSSSSLFVQKLQKLKSIIIRTITSLFKQILTNKSSFLNIINLLQNFNSIKHNYMFIHFVSWTISQEGCLYAINYLQVTHFVSFIQHCE